MDAKYLILVICINSLLLIINLLLIRRWRRNRLQLLAYQNIEHLNSDLRAQRHDFLNHLQVTHGLIALKEYEEAMLYLNKIYGKINQLNNNIRTDKIAINALLQTKSHEAEQKKINFVVDASSNLSLIKMEEWELCGCLSNLIDNAFEATLMHDGIKYVWVKIFEDMQNYYLSVSNTGISLTEDDTARIFDEGVSNKEESGHGLGLFLVRNALKDYGEIHATSTEFGMIFTISLKKESKKEASKV